MQRNEHININVQLMKHIDFWLGIPLCLFFTCYKSISEIINFNARKKESIPQKILFIKLSELGAIVLAYPLLRHIKEKFPRCELFFVTFKGHKGIFNLLGQIIPNENILEIRNNSLSSFILDTFYVIRKLEKEHIYMAFDLEFFSRYTAIFAYLIKAKQRIGFYRYTFEGLYRGNFLTHKIQYNHLIHISKAYLSLGQAIETEKKNTPDLYHEIKDTELSLPKYLSRCEIKEKVQKRLNDAGIDAANKLFLINPGEGNLPIREWPLNNFISLSDLLLRDKSAHIIIVGCNGANDKSEILLKAVNSHRCINFSGKTSLDELMELFNIADALITSDCGLAHLAMLTKINKFIIFGPESPQVFAPLGNNTHIIYSNWPCSPCLSVLNHRNSKCADNKCLKIISPENIYKLVHEATGLR